jgi:hypothetical protein
VTHGQDIASALARKTAFYDAHEQRTYARMVEVAARVIDDPTLIERGRAFLERFTREDPHQRDAYRAWNRLLRRPATDIARQLLADTERGAWLRDTAPVFAALPAPEKA